MPHVLTDDEIEELVLAFAHGIRRTKEAGVDFTADAFFGLYGPARMNSETVQRLSRAVADAMKQPDVVERVYGLGLVPAYAGPAELAATQAAQLARWEAPIKSSGFKAE